MTRSSQTEERFDALAAQVYDWVESAVALDAGHFPNELLSDLGDLMDELKSFLDEEGGYKRSEVTELFITPEMAEVVDRFPKVRRMLEGAWGAQLLDTIAEESAGIEPLDEEDEEDE